MTATQHLLSIDDLGISGINDVMAMADSFSEVSERPIPKVPALRGKTIATLFFEESTRTRLSFEAAVKRLSADTMSFSVSSSAIKKGESLRDTVQTIDAMGVDAIVVRHSCSGVPMQVTRWTSASVINAGDGWHEHPTQALLDCYTIRQWLGLGWSANQTAQSSMGEHSSTHPHRTPRRAIPAIDSGEKFMSGLRIAIVGDVKHSRVARSNVKAFTALGAEVVLVGPQTLMPPSLDGWPVSVATSIDDVVSKVDIVYLLRLQAERTNEALIPSLREYTQRWGLTIDRARELSESAIIMHPGPMNRGVEIAPEVAEFNNSTITAQVHNGVAVRMAAIFLLLGSHDLAAQN